MPGKLKTTIAMEPFIVTIDNSNKETVKQLFINNWGFDFMVTKVGWFDFFLSSRGTRDLIEMDDR